MKKWRIPLAVSLGCAVVWWTHKALTEVFPPFECAADTALWIVGSALKLATIICIPFALGWVFARCQGNLGRTARAVAVWGTALVALLVVLSVLRVPLAHMLNNDSSRYYPTSMSSPEVAMGFDENLGSQVANWQSGRTFLTELGVIVSFVLLLGVFAYISKGCKIAWGIGVTLLLGCAMIAANMALGLFVWDYDIFFGATLTAPLSMDIIFPFVATDPCTEIGCLFYLVLIWSSWVLDAFVLREARPAASAPA